MEEIHYFAVGYVGCEKPFFKSEKTQRTLPNCIIHEKLIEGHDLPWFYARA